MPRRIKLSCKGRCVIVTTLTFKNQGQKEYLVSTGERINYYTTSEMGLGANTFGWYITEIDGGFSFNRFDTLRDGKESLVRRYTGKAGA